MKLERVKIEDNHNKTGRWRKNWKFSETMDAVVGSHEQGSDVADDEYGCGNTEHS